MTVVSQIITDAFRRSNLIAVGTTPTNIEAVEALRYLNRIVKSTIGNEAGDPLIAFPVGRNGINRPSGYPWWDTIPDNNWFVPKDTRIMLNLESHVELWLHPEPNNGTRFAINDVAGTLSQFPVTIHGNGRLIEGQESITLNQDGLVSEWFYRDDLSSWQKYAELTEGDDMPFPEEFDTYFITMLCIDLNPSYGAALDDQAGASLVRSRRQLRARYNQVIQMPVELALIRMPHTSYDRWIWGSQDMYDSSAMFTKGWPF